MKQPTWDQYSPLFSRRSSRWAASDRGWLIVDGAAVGNYLDYGPDHLKSDSDAPGMIHCVSCPQGPDGQRTSRYVETVAEACDWIERTAGVTDAKRAMMRVTVPPLYEQKILGTPSTYEPEV